MKFKSLEELSDFYFQRFAYQPPQISASPHPDARLIVVIPCFNEKDLLGTLKSLAACWPPDYPCEVIVVINSAKHASEEIQRQNEKTYQEAREWISFQQNEKLHFYLIRAEQLPPRQAGVGLARKIGMDEALHRFGALNKKGGIVCLDADCRVEPNYFQELEKHFLQGSGVLTLYFEHRLDQSPELNEGIINYELFLRYYIQGLKYSGFPQAFHTIGSSMAVRADLYASSGGMNKRKAGEDFYFLHKVAQMAPVVEMTQTTVYPSARISKRVPFGTGKAQEKWLAQADKTFLSYAPQTFEDLRLGLEKIPRLFQISSQAKNDFLTQLPKSLKEYWNQTFFWDKIKEINAKSPQLEGFMKHFWAWQDGLAQLKWVHYARDHHYPDKPITSGAAQLLSWLDPSFQANEEIPAETLCRLYRERERGASPKLLSGA
ncbi:MAG: glycosyltransferase family A protein [Bacteroidota bacterium]